jgi:hypothetical protein
MKTFRNRLVSIWMKIPKPYPELTKLLMSYDSRWKAPEILFLGDSVLGRIAREDTDRRTLDQMVEDFLTSRKRLLCISHPAYNLRIYYHLLQIFKCTRQKPKQVILPINMRSFSPQWDLNPAWQFNEEIDALKKYVQTSGRRTPIFKKKSGPLIFSEADKMMGVEYPFTSLNCIGQFIANQKRIVKNSIGKNKYSFSITFTRLRQPTPKCYF